MMHLTKSKFQTFAPWLELKDKEYTTISKDSRKLLTKLNIFLPNDSVIVLGIYPNELKNYIHRKTYTHMFYSLLPN